MKVKILQWNVWYKEDIQNVKELIKEINPDVVCLQELTVGLNKEDSKNNTPQYLAKELGFNYYSKEITLSGNKFKLANAIFTKFKIGKTFYKWVNEETGKGGYDDEYRAYIEVEIDSGGKPLTIGTTHLSYTHMFEPTARKLEEVDKLIDLINKKQSGYVLTGDFNAKPGSEVINKIEKCLKNCGPSYDTNTWTTKPFYYNGFNANTLDWRLDYVFIKQ